MNSDSRNGSLGPLMIDLKGTGLDAEEREWLQAAAVGGVILFTRNFTDLEQLGRLVGEIHAARNPPLLVAVDHEGGRVQRFRRPFTELPPVRALGRLYDRNPDEALKAARAFGWLTASELRALDIDLSFAPVVDLDLGMADVIGNRALHPGMAVVSALSAEFSSGANAAGMAVTAKHFPTHAGARADSHTALAIDDRALDQLNDDLGPYRHLIAAGLESVMVGHVIFPAVDPLPASLSPFWMRDQLRDRLGFDGAVLSDDMSMAGADVGSDCQQRILASLQAGCDMVLLCNAPSEIPGAIEALASFRNPGSGPRLARLRGSSQTTWKELRKSEQWRAARERLDTLAAAAW
ncbi:MAG: beta-N-acetylhexosaminidase [Rhodospirillaceae bacterium]|nr:beta-N-acetylhexosaminidase [Rhodospirillaceae bacterium]MDE0362628.1 beta-N-acetylhexosaminidase [Rhodospirillaceae bacterium]